MLEALLMPTATVINQEQTRVRSAALFQHLLLPIDGSDLSLRAFAMGLELAKTFGAKVLALHVVPPFNSIAYMAEILVAAKLSYSQQAVQSASRYLDNAKELAKAAQVPCECHYAFGERPHEAILEAVNEHHCDLIVMATHGLHGLNQLTLGSETQKVLLRSRVPVLVCR
jgi:nucleotide-binding universal stress UspA family protein